MSAEDDKRGARADRPEPAEGRGKRAAEGRGRAPAQSPADDEGQQVGDETDRALDLRITEYLKLGVPAATVACAVAAGYAQGAPAVMLVLAGGALVAAIAIFWASVRTLVGETPLSGADAYALGAPRAEEEQKRAVLRALKDLEFERGVGKISEEDYQALVTRYRAEAKRLLRVLDEGSQAQREKVEALVQKRLARERAEAEEETSSEASPDEEPAESTREPAKAPKEAAKAPPKEAAKAPPKEAAKPAAGEVACAKCGTKNDADAVFCKKCGTKRGAEPEPEEANEENEAERDQDGDRKEASA